MAPIRPYSTDPRQIPEAERLIKQTYSVHVSLPVDRHKGIIRKWHLSASERPPFSTLGCENTNPVPPAAYFSQARLDQLTTVDAIRGIGDTPVPEGWFRSARTAKARRNTQTQLSEPESPKQHSPTTMYDPHSPFGSQNRQPSASSSYSHHSSSSSSGHSSNASSISSLSGAYQQRSHSLVPLEVLQSLAPLPRDPTDIQTLRRFASGTS